ncbi:hypothetical protein N7462_005924 [Penicillium macrosclerotiorum]|uniref:uncharacterized protein n=1 Tax=Penicillium macrosclerotiorum TaxID=303699 RepID=UPI0025487E8A|nr:uncharacterized protein N7462_005924 [Penicillium macrosclerotiorum]KAJ5682759.1 hypothetical protein N7462_005924 [Penicillium macrosclerotiorum]
MIADSLMVSNMIEPQVNARSAAVQGKYAEACLDEPSKRPNANRRPDQTTRAMGPSYRNPARQIVERQRLGSESDQSLSRRNQNRAGNISSGLETHPQGIEKQEKGIWPFNFSWEDIWDNACVANPNSPFGWFKPSTNEVVDHMVDDDESNIDNSKNRGVLPEAFSIPDAKASFTTASSPSFDSRFQKSVTALQIGSSEALSDQKVLSSDVNEVMQAKTQIPEGLPICPVSQAVAHKLSMY